MDSNNTSAEESELPAWLASEEPHHRVINDPSAYIGKSLLTIAGVLRHFRIDDCTKTNHFISAPAKMLFVLGFITLVSLSKNFAFTAFALACVILRMSLLKPNTLQKTFSGALAAGCLSAIIMLPALFIGQGASIALISAKTFISVALVLSTALSTPFNMLTAGLRAFRLPHAAIMVFDLSLKSIVALGQVACNVLQALTCRNVGKDKAKKATVGSVGGIVLLKSQEKALITYDALRCRGFTGEYKVSKAPLWKKTDVVLLPVFAALLALFLYLQALV